MEKILIIGSGGHARSLLDIIKRENIYQISGLVVKEASEKNDIGDYPILGTDSDLDKLFKSGIKNAAIGIGYLGKSNLREELWNKLKNIGYLIPVICDSSAILAENVQLGEGTMVGKGAIINANVTIGKMCIINTGAIIEHDCKVEEFSHISVGSVLCGEVQVGKSSFVGANATVIQRKRIGSQCIIGAGIVLRKNLEDNSIVWSRNQT